MIAERARLPVVATGKLLRLVVLGLAGRSRFATLAQLAGLIPSQISHASLAAEVEQNFGLLGLLHLGH